MQYSDITGFDAGSFVGDKENFYDLMREPGFFGIGKQPYDDAVEGFRRLCDRDHEVHIVTSPHARSPYSEKDKKAWVEHYLPFFDLHFLTMTHHKHLFGCDLLLDDRPRTLEKVNDSTLRFAIGWSL